ncbi:hypothetical protein ACIPW5_25835 [Streptomyces sp. NPDC090077]|uniref:hypothetical protein n=1 Tax=Streptomyces sp. NPDC090077 TaxID=3365938 RepID=UPI003801C376
MAATVPTPCDHTLSLTEEDIEELRHGWKDSRRWQLGPDPTYTALALRDPEEPQATGS